MSDLPYWSVPLEKLISDLGSSPEGLRVEAAREILARFGPNRAQVKKKTSRWGIFLGQFKNPIVLILLFATAISFIVQDWVDATIILAIVIGSALLSFFQEYSASDAVEKLEAKVSLKASVLRAGLETEIPADQIVPGDVVLLSAGSLIPADGVLIEAKDFFVNQAVLTGETFPVEKHVGPVGADADLVERTNAVFQGTNVRSGTAKMLVVETAGRTAFGQLARSLVLRPPETGFERGVRQFGMLLSQLMIGMVVLVFALNIYFQKPLLDSLLFSIALAVGLTPQLLPAIISITLSKGSQTMANSGVIVHRLNAIENFGSMDVLCTDKTGTLTVGVVKLDGALDPVGKPSSGVFRLAYLNASLQNGLKNPLDQAIISALPAEDSIFDPAGALKLGEIPYDFNRKRLSVLVADQGIHLLVTKGALDSILDICSHIHSGEGFAELDDARLAQVQALFQAWSGEGYRVLGVAEKIMGSPSGTEPDSPAPADENGMVFAGFLLFFDPPKEGARETIGQLSDLGVSLKVITGDNKLVALHTAQAIGLEVSGVLTGKDLAGLSEEALWSVVERTNLFAEVDPNQKERILSAVQKRGHIVGYLGDGINDSPSLHRADVGISVDSAVDVAKQAADLVLLEHDLGVLKDGIILGRKTFANTLKYVFVTTSANFGNMFSMAGASLFIPFLPLLPFQLLLTNFMTDFPAVTIAGDSVDREMILRPRPWDIAFIRKFMITFGLISSAFDYLVFGLLLVVFRASQTTFRTAWFVESVLTELLIMLVIRTQRPFIRSAPGRGLLVATLSIAAVTLVLPYIPGLNGLLGFEPLPAWLLGIQLAITLIYILINEFAKRIFFRRVGL